MSEFREFAKLVNQRFNEISKDNLFSIKLNEDEDVFNFYLDSFPEGTNNIFRERREYDCNTCKQFIRRLGLTFSIIDNKFVTVWDINIGNEVFQTVADKMRKFVLSRINENSIYPYYTNQKQYGTETTPDNKNIDIFWSHFWGVVPNKYVTEDYSKKIGEFDAKFGVFKRGLTELSNDAFETYFDLVDEIYRGVEFKKSVEEFYRLKKEYNKLKNEKDKLLFLLNNYNKPSAQFRNTVIGTFITDLSNGVDVNDAVKMFESKVAPTNYKRTKSVITKSMINNAVEKLKELGLENAVNRRYARINDISVNNILWANRDARQVMKDSLTDLLMEEVVNKPKTVKTNQKIKMEDFINNILPNTKELELLVENRLFGNFITLTTSDDNSKLFKWDNQFAWSYDGNVTDAIKEKVKKAGGNIDADVRVSLHWFNLDDLDLHVIEPNGNEIYFSRKKSSNTGGELDVDMNVRNPIKDAVENIVWTDKKRMSNGKYKIIVNNYTKRESVDIGFEIEIEIDGQSQFVSYNKMLGYEENVVVGYIHKKSNNDIVFVMDKNKNGLVGEGIEQEKWNVTSNDFVKVETVLLSPNYWDGQEIGNKHFIFVLDGCKNPESVRGFYNEYLRNDLNEHRKVFEILADKMKCKYSEEQVSGLGFSETVKNSVFVKADGKVMELTIK